MKERTDECAICGAVSCGCDTLDVERVKRLRVRLALAERVVEVARRVVGAGLPSWPGGPSSPVFDLREPLAEYDKLESSRSSDVDETRWSREGAPSKGA